MMSRHSEETRLLLGTTVSICVVGPVPTHMREQAIERAFAAMRFVEETCSRFDETSALRELCRHPGKWMTVPDILFESVRVALEVSELTEGVFDPTIGGTLSRLGFTRHYATGEQVSVADDVIHAKVTYRDIELDETTRSIRLCKPLLLDLGAVAKGLAVDLAARELSSLEGFAINAGGDVYVHGVDPRGDLWTIGIQHPFDHGEQIAWLEATDVAVCTSGSYERRSPLHPEMHHIVHPGQGRSDSDLVSCTVLAPLTMLADAVSTAAFLLGAKRAKEFVDDMALAALFIRDTLEITMTESMRGYMR